MLGIITGISYSSAALTGRRLGKVTAGICFLQPIESTTVSSMHVGVQVHTHTHTHTHTHNVTMAHVMYASAKSIQCIQ